MSDDSYSFYIVLERWIERPERAYAVMRSPIEEDEGMWVLAYDACYAHEFETLEEARLAANTSEVRCRRVDGQYLEIIRVTDTGSPTPSRQVVERINCPPLLALALELEDAERQDAARMGREAAED